MAPIQEVLSHEGDGGVGGRAGEGRTLPLHRLASMRY